MISLQWYVSAGFARVKAGRRADVVAQDGDDRDVQPDGFLVAALPLFAFEDRGGKLVIRVVMEGGHGGFCNSRALCSITRAD